MALPITGTFAGIAPTFLVCGSGLSGRRAVLPEAESGAEGDVGEPETEFVDDLLTPRSLRDRVGEATARAWPGHDLPRQLPGSRHELGHGVDFVYEAELQSARCVDGCTGEQMVAGAFRLERFLQDEVHAVSWWCVADGEVAVGDCGVIGTQGDVVHHSGGRHYLAIQDDESVTFKRAWADPTTNAREMR